MAAIVCLSMIILVMFMTSMLVETNLNEQDYFCRIVSHYNIPSCSIKTAKSYYLFWRNTYFPKIDITPVCYLREEDASCSISSSNDPDAEFPGCCPTIECHPPS
ncbi:hypothetical protein DFA_08873 [Cavenderia fasciculata]|uniref:Uncharacterized protein n=1 Tax=Cavenderia fasciculata TaxID=261658 RepID=F4Q4S6_CACFS|nr:uncharacterized protein DFA_08873 [Cavenderia fasciculata]EGG17872.1 hypothetical protein DFA_08873 [Cavenderia fasciculata]|eukprot:XP_004356356.1 hypothetical protein DFA_08873 [Cavenderia fasciculata]